MIDKNELRYFLYARKSSESEDRQMASIEDQKNEVRKIADELKLNVVGVFEESKSAKAPGRNMFNKMLQDIENGEADAILCWKLNRLARNPVDGGKISWMLQNNCIKHIQCFGRDYRPSDNVLMMQVELGMANQYVKDLSVDVKRGMRRKAERGWNPFPVLPLGYLHSKDSKGRVMKEEIIIDKKRFPIVKKLWGLMLTGAYSIADIKREGDKYGLVNENGKPYVIHTYHKLFSTEFYYGYFYWKGIDGTKKRFKGSHVKMISQKEFDKVQSFIDKYRRPTRAKNYRFTYKGLMNCGECGRSITAERKFQVRCTNCKNKFSCLNRNSCPKCDVLICEMKSPTIIDIIYYRCTKWKTDCGQKCISEEELEEQYRKALKSIEIPQGFHKFVTGILNGLEQTENKEQVELVGQLKKRKKELENRLQGLNMLRADGEIGIDEYKTAREETSAKIKKYSKEINSKDYKISNWIRAIKEHLDITLDAQKILKIDDITDKRTQLLKIASNQTLLDKKLHFKKTKSILAIGKCLEVYKSQKDTFEPKNHLMDKGDCKTSDTLDASLCSALHELRTHEWNSREAEIN